MEEPGVTAEVRGGIVEVVDPAVKSALGLVRDMPRLFDLIYTLLPDAYNAAPGKFGKIDGVKGSATGKSKYKTRYYRELVPFSYGEGYVYPLVYGLVALIKKDGDKLQWMVDPEEFVKKHLAGVMKSYYSMITGQNYDFAKVGESNGAYNLARDLFTAAYKDDLLKEHGLD